MSQLFTMPLKIHYIQN